MSSVAQFQTTTVRLPKHLYEEARTAVKQAGAASSMNDFMIEAIEEKLRQMREQEIDQAFAEMGRDEQYQKEAVALARSFAKSDWEAYQATSDSHNERTRKKNASKTSSR